MYDSIDTAMYDMVHSYPGGAVKLSAKVNMNAGTLNNKINPAMESHHLTLKEAVNLMNTTQNFQLLHAVCQELGFACVPVDHLEGVSDVEFLTMYTVAMKEVGDLSNAIHHAFSDGIISSGNVKQVKRETLQAMAALAELPARIAAMCDE